MTTAAQTQERRQDPKETVDALVARRQKTLEAYCSMSGVSSAEQAADGIHSEIAPVALQEFLNVMVDYTALGHFNIYQRINEGQERRAAVREAADRVYPAIGETTDAMVEFNDKYENFDGSAEEQQALRQDLSKIGEMLAIRGELEDVILQAILDK